ncbi:MAG: (d)CMP kinase [Planctomycetota bacterium]|jgi:cytidylate kinase
MPHESPEKRSGVIITIDGPAGTGKSTVARLLAIRLGLNFLDTGAMYRAAALIAIERGIDPRDGRVLATAVEAADLRFDFQSDPARMMLGDRDVSRRIRDVDVGELASIVATRSELRRVLVEQQRRVARQHPRLVSEGRDQGSVVFPDAALRLYLDADVDVRAGRRALQLAEAGIEVDRERIVGEIQDRDRRDENRRDAPLVRPRGSVAIDTTRLTAEQVVDAIEAIARERLPDAGFEP